MSDMKEKMPSTTEFDLTSVDFCPSVLLPSFKSKTGSAPTKLEGIRSRGTRRRLLQNDVGPIVPAKKKVKANKSKTEQDVEAEFDTQWICCECKEAECQLQPEATEMLVCDGPCRRLVHYPCAGLNTLPSAEENFYCKDCTKRNHGCMICGDYGVDDSDVFLCSKPKCGLFFHESCLDMQNVKVDLVSTNESEGKALQHPVFVCPAHSCWTCAQHDLNEAAMQLAPIDEPSPLYTKIKKKKRRGSIGSKVGLRVFDTKSDSCLLRCIECARSYHITCIPPSAKFHELAVLCHEHAEANKLPELDKEISFQRAFEQRAEAIVNNKRNCNDHRAQVKQLTGDNVFFCGMEGSNPTSHELRLLAALVSKDRNDENQRSDTISFCLPCDIKDEVHSKPPGYKHVNSLQYQPGNKPPRLPQASDVCECVGVCNDDCINRTLYTECFGDPSIVNGSTSLRQLTNCKVGLGCGNRQLGQRKTAKCRPAPEPGRGWGLIALQRKTKNDLVVEYVGEVIDEKTKEHRLKEWSKEHPNDTNFYIMALQSNWYIDARFVANTARFVNHSCDPNCVLLPINVNGWSRCGIFALRDIAPGEFLSYDYHFDTQQTDKFICCCGALNCRGTMKHQSISRNRLGDDWEVAKAEYHRDIKFLDSRQMNTTSLVSSYVPGADLGSKDEFVGNGPQKKHIRAARHNRMFLPRNAVIGYEGFARLLGGDTETNGGDSNDSGNELYRVASKAS